MIYWRMYVQDYLSATTRISMLEHGAYMLLLAYYYADEHPLPADKDDVCRIIRAITPVERKAVDNVLKKFFSLEDDGWHQDRADHEIGVSRTARENGSFGGRPRTRTGTESVTGTETGSQTETVTKEGTETITGEGGGSGQPFSLSTKNNPINQTSPSQPSSLSTNTTVKTVTPTASPPSSRKAKAAPNPATTAAWNAYATAYLDRYHTEPVRNAKVNTHIARLVERVGATEAPEIAAFYLTHSRSSYVASKHDAKFLDMDAEGLRTEWATGQKITQTQANQADRTQATGTVFQKLISEALRVADDVTPHPAQENAPQARLTSPSPKETILGEARDLRLTQLGGESWEQFANRVRSTAAARR